METARCYGRTTNPASDFWYPDSEEPEEDRQYKTKMAKAICSACPVKEECLRYAIDNNEVYGIWGGKSPRERSLIRTQWQLGSAFE